MKRFSWRGLAAVGLVAAIAFAVPAIASAGSGPGSSTSQRTFRHELQVYRASRDAIEQAFTNAVKQARSLYYKTLATATTSAERSAALQTMETAIIDAAATRSAALITLGNPPTKVSGTFVP